jgi:hypothetical protein
MEKLRCSPQKQEHQMQDVTEGREPCPFIYAKGKKCTGHVVRIEAFKIDVTWQVDDAGQWSFSLGEPRSHYHLYCSEKDNHAGYGRPDSEQMKFYYGDLPPALQEAIKTP